LPGRCSVGACFFFSSRRRHTSFSRDWSSDVCSSDLLEKPILKEQWAGAVDTVGGEILFNVVKSLRRGASVACCGLTAGTNFQANVLPFILRGVNLLGVDSVEIPLITKASMRSEEHTSELQSRE